MKYQGNLNFTHSQKDKLGILITNLGTPDAPKRKQLKAYLKEFLSDPRVVEVPRLIWWCVLNLVILNIRPSRSAKAYQTVWTDQGSPLLVHTQAQANKLRESLTDIYGDNVIIDFAMRYGSPSVENVVSNMLQQGVRKLIVLPMYPQYCASTTGSTFDAISQTLSKQRWVPELQFISHYHDKPDYIQAMADKIRDHWQTHERAEKLIFSYHGIPKRYLLNGDPYHCECYKTSRLIAENLGLDKDQYFTCFQSRFGREEWLKPYTDHSLKQFAADGVKSVQVVCPGFSADCLETIEEIGIENRDYFLEAGGQRYEYIPALNSDDSHIKALQSILTPYIDVMTVSGDSSKRATLAQQMGAS